MLKVTKGAFLAIALLGSVSAFAANPSRTQSGNGAVSDEQLATACCSNSGDLGSAKAECEAWAAKTLRDMGVNVDGPKTQGQSGT